MVSFLSLSFLSISPSSSNAGKKRRKRRKSRNGSRNSTGNTLYSLTTYWMSECMLDTMSTAFLSLQKTLHFLENVNEFQRHHLALDPEFHFKPFCYYSNGQTFHRKNHLNCITIAMYCLMLIQFVHLFNPYLLNSIYVPDLCQIQWIQ